MDKKQLSERDICTKFITPAVTAAGWDALLGDVSPNPKKFRQGSMARKFSLYEVFSGKLAVAPHVKAVFWRRRALPTKYRFRESRFSALLRRVVWTAAEFSGVWAYIAQNRHVFKAKALARG